MTCGDVIGGFDPPTLTVKLGLVSANVPAMSEQSKKSEYIVNETRCQWADVPL